MHGTGTTESDMGDYIGTESCADLMKGGGCGGGDDGDCGSRRDQRCGSTTGRDQVIRKGTKEFPPPIRCLARTENVPSSHLPWVMKRYYTGDGRLIIREEKAPNSDFLRAHRSNGRLTLQLVPMAQEDGEGGDSKIEVEEEEVRENVNETTVVVPADDEINRVAGGGGGGKAVVGGGGIGVVGVKCYNYETVRTSTCVYVMQVPAM